MKAYRALVCLALGMLFAVPQVFAQAGGIETKVMVRALARDAKIIGKEVGGARITIRDVSTGKVLAEGTQMAGTGDTAMIIVKPHVRGTNIYDTPGASGYLAVLHLEQPTVVEISAEGPLGHPQATQRASTTMLLVPGEDVLGDGVLLELHGFIVTALAPQADAAVKAGSPFAVKAKVTMNCGCPTEPGGHWDSNKIKVVARVIRAGKIEAEIPMQYAGVVDTYSGNIPATTPGQVELQFLAMDGPNANFGLARENLTVVP
ncbi:MAG TPA: hypothetical protein VNI36_10685 [Candidatus Dormibacteraeota bacterium]|nr:hypothetical protein [Candidatus Dormibacteraeota bacterium]